MTVRDAIYDRFQRLEKKVRALEGAQKMKFATRLGLDLELGGTPLSSPRSGDAGYDLRATEKRVLYPNMRIQVSTGIFVAIPEGYVGIIKDRSSMALKGIRTHGGVIDSSYRGELIVMLSNLSEGVLFIEKGERVAQLLIVPCITPELEEVSFAELGKTERGSDGFGSTGR